MNTENLLRLADYLGALPADYEHFDMSVYCRTPGVASIRATKKSLDCGSVACAVGHAPFAFPELPPLAAEEWDDYSARLFGLSPDGDDWWWCFSGSWSCLDNTPAGAAARIRWLVEHGLPDDAYEQSRGDAPLCYRVEIEP